MKTVLTSALFFSCLFLMLPNKITQAQIINPADQLYSVPEDALPYFFNPTEFSPLQTGVFKDVAPLFSEHSLSAINRNPAAISKLQGTGYFYADVKTLPEAEQTYVGCEVCLAIYNPYYTQSRQIQEPFLSTAVFFKPIEQQPFWMGFTYQYMKSSESFYQTPISYYDPGPIRFASDAGTYFGEESTFNKSAHFPSFYAGYSFSEELNAGLKVSYNHFSGNGNAYSDNYAQAMDLAPTPYEYSQWRNNDYHHWDFSGGLNWIPNEQTEASLSAGFLLGDFNQSGNSQIMQDRNDIISPTEDYYYVMDSNYSERTGFDRSGKTYYTTAEFNRQIDQKSSIHFLYRGSLSDQDFEFGGATLDDSFIENRGATGPEGQVHYSRRERMTHQLREGVGDQKIWRHNMGAFITYEIRSDLSFKTGIQVQVLFDKQDFYNNIFYESYNYQIEQTEGEAPEEYEYSNESFHHSKINVRNHALTGYIPVVLSQEFSRFISADLGVLVHRQHLIRKVGTTRSYGGYLPGDTYYDEDRTDKALTYYNAFGAITINPADNISFRLMTFSDRRNIGMRGSMDSFRFRVSMEVGF